MLNTLVRVALGGALLTAMTASSSMAIAHDIYTGVHGQNGQLCCGGGDCAPTVYRERGGTFEFLTREREWVAIPQERITFLPIPGDPRAMIRITPISATARRQSPTGAAPPRAMCSAIFSFTAPSSRRARSKAATRPGGRLVFLPKPAANPTWSADGTD
jgi:hypothetical protein